MFAEMERLDRQEALYRLLSRYAEQGSEDRELWRDRVMEMEGVSAKELVRLHGDLIAFDWIEQNTGCVPVLVAGTVPQCYRVTRAGLKAFRLAKTNSENEEDLNEAA